MNEVWQKLYELLAKAGLLEEFSAIMREQAMTVARIACQVGQGEEARRDAISEMRFCLCRADEAAKALAMAREQANSRASAGFQKGGAPLA